mmetsp:Transcript_18343/g.32976  ORF Transcript_18343/g.32976 Transcript_18343/m.32976 type:complete len:863 (-) Transcript_18343:96-2684(-)
MQSLQQLVDDTLKEIERLDVDPAGLTSEAIHRKKTVLRNCLVEAVSYIQRGQVSEAVQALKALVSVQNARHPEFYAREISDIYNNIACAYKSTGQVHTAKKYLEKVKEYMPCLPDEDKASLYLNFCAVYSALGNHDLAYSHGRKALLLAQEAILHVDKDIDTSHLVNVLAASYHNMGVEEEYRKNTSAAEEYYLKAVQVLEQTSTSAAYLKENCLKSLEGIRKAKIKVRPVSSRAFITSSPTRSGSRSRLSVPKRVLSSARTTRTQTTIPRIFSASRGVQSKPLKITTRPIRTVSSLSTFEHRSKRRSGASKSIQAAAAAVIQRSVKQWIVRRRKLNEQSYGQALPHAVNMIQASFRGWLSREAYTRFSGHDIGYTVIAQGKVWLNDELYAYKISQTSSETKIAVLNTEKPDVKTCIVGRGIAKPASIVSALRISDGRLYCDLKYNQEEADERELKAVVLKIEKAYLKHKETRPLSTDRNSKNLLTRSSAKFSTRIIDVKSCICSLIHEPGSLVLKIDNPSGLDPVDLKPYLAVSEAKEVASVIQMRLKVHKGAIFTGLPDLNLVKQTLKLKHIPRTPLRNLVLVNALAKLEMKLAVTFMTRLTSPQFNRKSPKKAVKESTETLRQLQSLIRGVIVRKRADFMMPISTETIVYKGSYVLNGRMFAVKVLRKASKLKIELEWSYHRRLIFLDVDLISHLEGSIDHIIEKSVFPCLRYDAESDCYYLEQSLLQKPEVLVTETVGLATLDSVLSSSSTISPQQSQRSKKQRPMTGIRKQRATLRSAKTVMDKSSSPIREQVGPTHIRKRINSLKPLAVRKDSSQREIHFVPVVKSPTLYSNKSGDIGIPEQDSLKPNRSSSNRVT